jgi:hypothetical protein
MQIATAEAEEDFGLAKPEKNEAAAEMGRQGAASRAARLSPEQRAEVALEAAVKRWENAEIKFSLIAKLPTPSIGEMLRRRVSAIRSSIVPRRMSCSNGTSEERIICFFGYSPSTIDTETVTMVVEPGARTRQRNMAGS